MFLKSLTLKGFKSFADTTTLEMEPGITVVVGPNGSGKSNVVDAVAWVLGAQAPSTVRSQKMDDVIFAGSSKRPALGRAEVSLTIDNSAGLLPIEFTEVTITRTLFRSGDSEYAINGVPCRLLDIQDMLSDTGVGRQQHVIVSQGQLDAVLNARPEDRRLIIEEAAGVLKFRKRKEKAERRLDATEGNLLRLTDLLREVRRQLRPLERQADAARRHGDLVGELSALRLHLAGRELSGLRTRLEKGAAHRAVLGTDEAATRADLARLDAAVMAAEAQLSTTDGGDLGDAVGRYEALRERARGLAALLAERRRSAERERAATVDASLVAATEADAARLSGELAEVASASSALVPEAQQLAAAEEELAVARAAFEEEAAAGESAATAEAASVRGELGALRSALEQARAERSRRENRLAALTSQDERLAEDAGRRRAELEQADEAEPPLVAAHDLAATRRAAADAVWADAEAALRAAEAEEQTWSARAEALALALDEARARAGAERLAGVEGVVGTLLELVEVDDGWQEAFEAAAGEAIAAVLVDGIDGARRAIEHLRAGGAAGAVLPLDAVRAAEPVHLSLGGEAVRAHVRSRRADVERLLDGLLADAVAVDGGWADALELSRAHPGIVAVTRDGDRFSSSGWRTGAAGAGATGAALDEARERSSAAAATAARARQAVLDARGVLAQAAEAGTQASAALEEHDDRRTALADALHRLESERAAVSAEGDALAAHVAELAERADRDATRVAELEAVLPGLEAEEAAGHERALAQRSARRRLEERAAAVTTLRTDLEVRAAGLDERRSVLTARLAEAEARLTRFASEREAAAGRRAHVDVLLARTGRLAALVEDRMGVIDAELTTLRDRRRRQSEAARAAADQLDALRRDRRAAEQRLGELRERANRAELDEAEARMRLEASTEALRRDFDLEPDRAMEAACPELPPGTTAPGRVRELERELRLMGPINPLALEEFTALSERHTFLEAQLDDVKSSRRELAKVIREIDSEIVEVFRAAYADVSENFVSLFETLFPGGHGRLQLTDPDNPLETGIEIEARPVGKNVRKLSLLSGGERSLTALAFLFAVFRSRPSPFYLMDEVEAALDDVNLHRFLDLIHEFREEAQLVIVSHQKRTMEAADCLYGVTMQPGGSSRVISEKVTAGA